MITIGLLIRNEVNNYLQEVLEQAFKLTGAKIRIVVIDDFSTDKSKSVSEKFRAVTYGTPFNMWEKNERFQRERLWKCCIKHSNIGDFIFILDADEFFASRKDITAIRNLILDGSVSDYDSLSFNLYDMWDDEHYRDDNLWNAHERRWIMAVRYNDKIDYSWKNTKLHCGRFPVNSCEKTFFTGLKIKHLGWNTEKKRQSKFDRYMRLDNDGIYGDLDQYKSILDDNVNLVKFDSNRENKGDNNNG